MKLPGPFTPLPLRFDATRLRAEVEALADHLWIRHPQDFEGNSALLLVSHQGREDDDSIRHPMAETPALRRSPYLREVLGSLRSTVGRTRLMRLEPGATVPEHVDVHPYWRSHLRVHVPVTTHPDAVCYCGYSSLHLPAGEAWILDTWQPHRVVNGGPFPRIHLVCDTVGSSELWAWVAGSPAVSPFPTQLDELPVEAYGGPALCSASDLRCALDDVLSSARADAGGALEALKALSEAFVRSWRDAEVRFEGEESRARACASLLAQYRGRIEEIERRVRLRNGLDAVHALREGPLKAASTHPAPALDPPPFTRPVFVLSPPRSGSSLLFEALARSPSVWTLGAENHHVFEHACALAPGPGETSSNALGAADATPEVAARLRVELHHRLRDARGSSPGLWRQPLRLVEKTPKNALRLPFLRAVWPDAHSLVLYREPVEVLSSMIEGWRSGRFVTYPQLETRAGLPWSFLLVPGWRDLIGEPLEVVVAHQWAITVERLLDNLADAPAVRVVGYRELVDDPRSTLLALCQALDLEPPSERFAGPLPWSRTTLTPPDPLKWRRHEAALARTQPIWEPAAARFRAFAREMA